MDFSFSPEQDMLRAQARSFLEKRFPAERVAQLASSTEGWDPASWKELAGLGWSGASIPEAQGGAGLGFLEEAIVFEELGRALYPGPYFATVGLSLPALASSPDLLRRVASGALTATLAWREPRRALSLADPDTVATEARCVNGRWLLRGSKHLVPDAGAVDAFVVLARGPDGIGLFLVDRRDGRPHVTVPDTVDTTRRLGQVTFDDDEGTLLAADATAAKVIARTRLRALTALALEAAGIASYSLALAVAHAKTRQQFGKPIGAYQAVSHKLADAYVETELARSLAYWAAWCLANEADATLAAPAAKAYAAEAAVRVCERAIQVHGGMGFTWEHPLHRYYKRALWIESFEASGAAHRAEIARALFDR
jgi:alkylation response protein AidB-like acyl-CoA dehydrogenase